MVETMRDVETEIMHEDDDLAASTVSWTLWTDKDDIPRGCGGIADVVITNHTIPENEEIAAYMIASSCILLIFGSIAAIGNSVVIIVVVRRRSVLHTFTHALVVNLAVSHLLASLTVVPMDAATGFNGGHWFAGLVSCKILRYLNMVFTSATVLTLSAIAIDRYYSVVYPLERKITLFRGRLIVLYIWLHSTIVCVPYLLTYTLACLVPQSVVCYQHWTNQVQGQMYFTFYSLITIFGPLLVTCLAYCFVWRAFRLSHRRVNVVNALRRPKVAQYLPYSTKTETRLLKMLLVMVFCYILFWGPFVGVLFHVQFTSYWTTSDILVLTAVWITRLQSVLDPFIYGYLNKQFRQSLYELLRVCPCQCTYNLNVDFTVTTVYGNSAFPKVDTTSSDFRYTVSKSARDVSRELQSEFCKEVPSIVVTEERKTTICDNYHMVASQSDVSIPPSIPGSPCSVTKIDPIFICDGNRQTTINDNVVTSFYTPPRTDVITMLGDSLRVKHLLPPIPINNPVAAISPDPGFSDREDTASPVPLSEDLDENVPFPKFAHTLGLPRPFLPPIDAEMTDTKNKKKYKFRKKKKHKYGLKKRAQDKRACTTQNVDVKVCEPIGKDNVKYDLDHGHIEKEKATAWISVRHEEDMHAPAGNTKDNSADSKELQSSHNIRFKLDLAQDDSAGILRDEIRKEPGKEHTSDAVYHCHTKLPVSVTRL
ncbi:unnamed protein product [Owenia fusiformis]|uniref:G-protein coupled receptors family 1 profile domain-containing protein n=1 Tax=Owenia fusiformis TaxID=6347 RepID=A0A8S4PIL7_OWEFU|nr:unnamed protein product [Owenia fusiformis]